MSVGHASLFLSLFLFLSLYVCVCVCPSVSFVLPLVIMMVSVKERNQGLNLTKNVCFLVAMSRSLCDAISSHAPPFDDCSSEFNRSGAAEHCAFRNRANDMLERLEPLQVPSCNRPLRSCMHAGHISHLSVECANINTVPSAHPILVVVVSA